MKRHPTKKGSKPSPASTEKAAHTARSPSDETPVGQSADGARRRLLLTLLGAGGVVAGGRLIPEHWSAPVVRSALLPVHAQSTPDDVVIDDDDDLIDDDDDLIDDDDDLIDDDDDVIDDDDSGEP